jgi:hypothetical protein
MTTKRRITLEITAAESTAYGDILSAVVRGLIISGPPGETRVICLSNTLVPEAVVLRAPEGRREGA